MQNIEPENLLIIDIETASQCAAFEDLEPIWQELWQEKVILILPQNVSVDEYYPQRAGVMAEFSKIICISIGFFSKGTPLQLRIKSFFGDEKKLLTDFIATINKFAGKWCFAGHNIKEFDMPFICRRMIVHGITLPPYLNFQNMKPWETNIVDTFQYWRFGDYKNYTSLKLLAASLGIPSPKDDIDGSQVGALYWSGSEEERLQHLKRIVSYCQKDVITTSNIILKFKNIPLLTTEDILVVE
ncbi:MAG: ribonuclease H-like domain-containing protein [Ferruginibacter sp.]